MGLEPLPTIIGLYASSWGCYGLGMVWNARTSCTGSAPCIYFFLLIIRGLFSSSSSSSSFVLLGSLAYICLGGLLDDVRGHLVCCSLSFNSEVCKSPNVKAFYTPKSTTSSAICWCVEEKMLHQDLNE